MAALAGLANRGRLLYCLMHASVYNSSSEALTSLTSSLQTLIEISSFDQLVTKTYPRLRRFNRDRGRMKRHTSRGKVLRCLKWYAACMAHLVDDLRSELGLKVLTYRISAYNFLSMSFER